MKKLGLTALAFMGVPAMADVVAYGSLAEVRYVATPLEKIPDLSPIEYVASEVQTGQMSDLALGEGLTGQINEAIVARDWATLERLLTTYPASPEYDLILDKYAQGAFYRQALKHKKAIEAYQDLLAMNPDFHYVRFDLAVMLFENKDNVGAKRELQRVKPHLNAQMAELAEQYLTQIDKRQKADTSVNLNYERTDNVNNASSATQINWQGKTWQKTADSLPKSATGVRYGVGVSKDKQLEGNHYLTASAKADGVHYWDIEGYDEQTLSAGLGYKYQDVNTIASIVPSVEHTWYDDEPYQYEVGMQANLNQRLSSRLNAGVSASFTKRYYDSDRLAKNYDSEVVRLSGNYRYALTPKLVLFGGVDMTDDDTKNPEFASVRYGTTLGVLTTLENGLGGRVSVRYAKREFEAPETLLYRFTRQDNEYYIQTAWWYDKWQYRGFVPNLHLNYRKIDSNMADLYSRDGVQSFVSVEKKF